ncbi:hypothetical protein D3C80_808320 [compost metagenome]
MDVSPRRITLFEPNGPAPDFTKFKPATFPVNASVQLFEIAFVNSSPFTVLIE